MTTGSILRKFLWVGLTSFGAARWTNLHRVFVRDGLIPEDLFMRDLAVTQTLPGPGFVNLTVLCGMRLGGWRMGLAAGALVLGPGLVAIALALAFLSGEEPWVARFLHGILVGAVGALAAAFIRLASRRGRSVFDASLAAATLLLIVAGVPLFAAILLTGVVGATRYRMRPEEET